MDMGYYIWRTAGDNKVRSEHVAREGLVFSWNDPPEGGHPGENHNCRCYARNIALNRCQQEEINYTNAYAAFFIAEQNLNRAIARKILLEQKLTALQKEIEEEKRDKNIATYMGGAAGALMIGIPSMKSGPGAAMKGASLGLGIGKLTAYAEDVLDIIQGKDILPVLEKKKEQIADSLQVLTREIENSLQNKYEQTKKDYINAKQDFQRCKEK